MPFLVLFFFFLFSSIIDVSFLSRFSILKLSPLLSLALFIFYWAEGGKNIFWALIPAIVFNVYSGKNFLLFFILFMPVCFLYKLFCSRFKEKKYPAAVLIAFFSAAFFALGQSIPFFHKTNFKTIPFMRIAAGIIIFSILEVLIFSVITWAMAIKKVSELRKNINVLQQKRF